MIRLTVFVTDTTAPVLQQGRGLLIITIIDINEQPPVCFAAFSRYSNYIFICYIFAPSFCRLPSYPFSLFFGVCACKLSHQNEISAIFFSGLANITLHGSLLSIKTLVRTFSISLFSCGAKLRKGRKNVRESERIERNVSFKVTGK